MQNLHHQLSPHRFFFLMLRRPPRSTLFPYTTLFRSDFGEVAEIEISRNNIWGGGEGISVRSSQNIVIKNNSIRESPVDRKSTRLNSSHANISYAVFCLKKKKKITMIFHEEQIDLNIA